MRAVISDYFIRSEWLQGRIWVGLFTRGSEWSFKDHGSRKMIVQFHGLEVRLTASIFFTKLSRSYEILEVQIIFVSIYKVTSERLRAWTFRPQM